MNYYIITGASKGLGFELSKLLFEKENKVFLLSRKTNEELLNIAKEAGSEAIYKEINLDSLFSIEDTMKEIFEEIDLSGASRIALINNAGAVDPIKPMDKVEDHEIVQNINLNLTAPLILTSSFLRRTKEFSGDKRIITISSGAGKRPIEGWGSYCVAKCGVDMMTKVVALEAGENGAKCISFGPGIMDTDMQATIRSSSEEDFKDVEKFKGFKSDGKLLKASVVAEKVHYLLYTEDDFEHGGLVNVSDYIKSED